MSRSLSAIRILWLVCALWCGWGVRAQEASLGGLRGRVIDEDFAQPVTGATVAIEGTDLRAVTDPDGAFFFNALPPGAYRVVVVREGYGTRRTDPVAVSAGRVAESEVPLSADVVELDSFVVAMEEETVGTEVQLLDLRQTMTSFVDTIGSDFIGKVGGGDVGDVLKRVVGTSVADSRYVVIRGLSDRYNTVLLNGARIPSSDPDKRAVNIDIFPSNLVGSLANTKTFTPDIPGESTGGSINIVTRTSPEKPFVQFSLGLGYNTQSTGESRYVTYPGAGTGILGTQNDRRIPDVLKSYTKDTLPITPNNPEQAAESQRAASLLDRRTGTSTATPPFDLSFSLSGGTRIEDFFGGPLGLLAAFTYSKKYDYDGAIRRAGVLIQGAGQRVLSEEFDSREGGESLLSGLLLSAGWEPDDNNTLKLTLFANVAADDRAYFQEGLVLDTGTDLPGTVPIASAQTVAVREGLQYVERRLRTLQLAGSHILPALGEAEVQWVAATSMSSQDEPDGRFATTQFDRATRTFTQLAEFSGQNLQRYWRHLDDTNYNLVMEIALPLFEDGTGNRSSKVRFGFDFDHTTREFRADTFGYNNAFFSGAGVPLVGELDPSNLLGLTAADQIGQSTTGIGRARNPEVYDASQTIAAWFGMIELDLAESVQAMFGARVEMTDIRVFRDPSAFFTAGGLLDATEGPVTDPFEANKTLPPDKIGRADIEEVDVLPAVSLSWDFAKDMKLRFAGSRTIARPSFKELSPIYLDDPVSADRFRGNTLLETSTIDNIDLRWEWFPGAGDVIAVSAFTKFIDKPIELFTSPSFDFFANQESASIYGLEFEIQKSLGFLDESLRPWSVGFNVSRFYSQVQLIDVAREQREFAGLDPSRRLQGQPDYLLNFNINYDNKESGLSAGLFLNVNGEVLYKAGSASGASGFSADVFQRPLTSLDAVLSKKFGDRWKVTLRAENLLNSSTERYSEGGLVYSRQAGTKYSLGVSCSW